MINEFRSNCIAEILCKFLNFSNFVFGDNNKQSLSNLKCCFLL